MQIMLSNEFWNIERAYRGELSGVFVRVDVNVETGNLFFHGVDPADKGDDVIFPLPKRPFPKPFGVPLIGE